MSKFDLMSDNKIKISIEIPKQKSKSIKPKEDWIVIFPLKTRIGGMIHANWNSIGGLSKRSMMIWLGVSDKTVPLKTDFGYEPFIAKKGDIITPYYTGNRRGNNYVVDAITDHGFVILRNATI